MAHNRAEYMREYYRKNRERLIEYQKKYREDNPDKVRAWKEAGKENAAAYQRRYAEDNKERITETKRKHYDKNSSRFAEKRNKTRRENAEFINRYKTFCGCRSCGYRAHAVSLDLHHRDPAIKKFNINNSAALKSRALLKEEIRKCDVLCSNCHRELHWLS